MSISLDMLYNLTYIPGLIMILIANHLWLYKYNCSKPRSLIYIVITIAVGLTGAELGGGFYNWVQSLHGIKGEFNRSIYGAVFFVLTLLPLCFLIEKLVRDSSRKKNGRKITDISLRDTLDMLQPVAMILLVTVKFRCLFVGCCYGIPCSWGVYNGILEDKAFPVQHLDIAVTLLIMWISYKYIHHRSFRRGTALFFSLGLWCFARFFLEFLMYYHEGERTFFGFLTLWQCVAILYISVCITTIVVLYRYYPAEPCPKTKQKAEQKTKRKTKKHH